MHTSGSDSISEPVSCTADQQQSADTSGTEFNGSCTNDAGLSTNASPLAVKLDKTKPAIDFTGDHAYGLLQTVNVSCTATDATSDIDTSDCGSPLESGPAFSFGPGSHDVSADATDEAGNTRHATTSFSVTATYADLCTLTEQFSSKKNENDLCNKLKEAQKAEAKGKTDEKQKKLDEYVRKVRKDVGKAFTQDEADTLADFAQSL